MRTSYTQVHAGRVLDKKYGSAWTVYLHFRRWYVELNFGRERRGDTAKP